MTEPRTGDAVGDLLQACWAADGNPGHVYEVVERDDGYVFARDASHYFTRPEEWQPLERQACHQAAGRVLDVGCGAGRHAVVLAEEGLDVVGLDVSPGAVAVSRDRGVRAHLGDVTRLDTDLGRFDTFLLLDNNLGLLGSAERAPVVLANLARVAAPGARVYGSSTTTSAEVPLPEEEVAYQERNRRAGRLPGQTPVRVRAGRTATEWFDYLLLTPEELEELATGTGWSLTDVSLHGANYLAELTLTE